MKDSFVFYRSFYEAIKLLNGEQRLRLYEAIFEYALNDIDAELSGAELAIYNLTKPSINSANARYNASVENGKRGGRPKNKNLEKPNHNLEKPRHNLAKPNHNLNDNVYVYDNDNVSDDVAVAVSVLVVSE